MLEEDVVPIENYTGYFISKEGKVYCNLGKGNRDKTNTVPMYEVNPRPNKSGYMRVCLRNDNTNKRDDLYVHRIVAEHFVENPNNKKCVSHINCIRLDNRAVNLEWCTTKENVHHAMKLGHLVNSKEDGRFVSNYNYEEEVKKIK